MRLAPSALRNGVDGIALYSRNPYNPYPSGDAPSYGLLEVIGLGRLGALLAPIFPPVNRRQMGASSSQSQVTLGAHTA